MALDWIKWIDGLERKRQVVAMAIALKPTGNFRHDCDLVAAAWMRVWNWAGKQTIDGHVPGVTAVVVDDVAGLSGFAAAAENVKWLSVKAGGLSFHDWAEHNGDAEKKRADAARRQRQKRERDSMAEDPSEAACHKNVTGVRDMSRGRAEQSSKEQRRTEEDIAAMQADGPADPEGAAQPPPAPIAAFSSREGVCSLLLAVKGIGGQHLYDSKAAAAIAQHPKATLEQVTWAIGRLKALLGTETGRRKVKSEAAYLRGLIERQSPPAGWAEDFRREQLRRMVGKGAA